MWRSLDLEMAIVRCKSQSTKDLTSAKGCWWCRLPSGSVNRFARQIILGFRRDINAKIGRNLKISTKSSKILLRSQRTVKNQSSY